MRKYLFCNTKQSLLSCKIGFFVWQNNGCVKALIASLLWDILIAEKHLHLYNAFRLEY